MAEADPNRRRRIERRTVKVDVVNASPTGAAQTMTLLNISPLGFQLHGPETLAPGDFFRVELPDLAEAVGKVVWSDGQRFGGQFLALAPTGCDGSEGGRFRIEYGPPQDRRAIVCPTAGVAVAWLDEMTAAKQLFVRILNAEGDVLSEDWLRAQVGA